MRLDVLDSDIAALAAAEVTAREALHTAWSASGVLAQAWRSGAGSAASDFLERQCTSGGVVVDALGAAAQTLRRLREDLAAATATGDEATEDVKAAYRRALNTLIAGGPVLFDEAAMPDGGVGSPTPAMPTAPTVPTVPTVSAAPAIPATPEIPSIPALPDLGGSLLGLVNAIASAIGGYSGDPAIDTAEPPAPTKADRPPVTPRKTAPKPQAAPEPLPAPEPVVTPAAPAGAPLSAPLSAPLAAEAPAPPPVSPPPAPERTPCEIAADELPQAGP